MSAHVAKGPLSSAAGQWAFVGLGAYAVAGGETLQSMAQSALRFGMQLASGTNLVPSDAQLRSSQQQQQPIVIHSVAPSGGTHSMTMGSGRPLLALLQLTIGAGICWGTYIVFSMFLPEQIKEMLPVTRKFFDSAITSLGNGILQVRDALTEQILGLSTKQEELADKQDETHVEVLSIRNDLGEVRFDLNSISDSVARCENSLTTAERRQSYTARGVRLLVRCVGAMMPGNARLAGELERFSQAGEEFHEGEDEVDQQKGGGNGINGKPQLRRSQSSPVRTIAEEGGENPQSQTPGITASTFARTPSYVTPSAAAARGPGSISSVETDPENAGHEESSTSNLPPPTPQDLDEVRMLLDMVRRGGTISVK